MTQILSNDAAGRFLATIDSRALGDEIFSVRPAIICFGSKGLTTSFCSECLLPIAGKLLQCSGCESLRYCSTSCQKKHWRTIHKLECGYLQKMNPNVPVGALLTVMRMVLLTRAGKGQAFRDMAHHKTRRDRTQLQDLAVLVQGVSALLGEADEDMIETYYHTVATNTMEFVSEQLEPLGVALDPKIALLNHSCEPNAYVTFQGGTAVIRAYRPIPAGDPILISYISVRMRHADRHRELWRRYLFDCQCARCTRFPETRGPLEAAAESYLCCGKTVSIPAQAERARCPLCGKDMDMVDIRAIELEAERALHMHDRENVHRLVRTMHRMGHWSPHSHPLHGLYLETIPPLLEDKEYGLAVDRMLAVLLLPLPAQILPDEIINIYRAFQTLSVLSGEPAQLAKSRALRGLDSLRIATLAWYLATFLRKQAVTLQGKTRLTDAILGKVDELEHDLETHPSGRSVTEDSRDPTWTEKLLPLLSQTSSQCTS